MNIKAVIPLVAGLGIGGVALKLGINTLRQARAAQPVAARATLWAAKEDIPRGSVVHEDMLQTMSFPTELVPTGAFQEKDKDKLVGRMPRLVVPAGLPILESMLAPPGSPAGINPKPGFRAGAVTIDAGSGVDYHLEPGSFVDVVGSFRTRNELIAKTIVENAEVAAVGPRVSPGTGAEGKVEQGKDKMQTVRAVTLYVRPDQVKRILLAEQQGRIKLSLRGNEDTEIVNDDTAETDTKLLGKEGEKAAAAASQPIEDSASFLKKLITPKPEAPAVAAVTPANPEPERWNVWVHRGDKSQSYQFRSRDSFEQVSGPTPANAKPAPATAPQTPPAQPPTANPQPPVPPTPPSVEPSPAPHPVDGPPAPPPNDGFGPQPSPESQPAADGAAPSPVN